MEERIYLSQPHITGLEKGYIDKAFETNNLTLFGQNVTDFESKMKTYYNGTSTLATASGTAALHLALRYSGIVPGSFVFCSSLTFIASCNPVLYQGATPVFIDSCSDDWNMSPRALERALDWAKKEGKLPKAAIVVDLYGQPAQYEQLLPMFLENNIMVIEDAAEALGSEYMGKKCGTFGNIGALSFNSNKLITTGGGGMAISEHEAAIEKMRYWSCQAREPLPYYEHKEYGYQYRMSNILAGIGCAQVDFIDEYKKKRQMIYDRYKKEFDGLPVRMMPKIANGDPNCWLSVMYLEKATLVMELITYLEEYNIETRMVWKPMHLQPVFHNHLYFSEERDTDISGDLFIHGICLPSASVMSEDKQGKVIELIKRFLISRN